jgi:endonuclease III
MTTTNRAALINKTHRAVKRLYKHSPLRGEQPLLETLLFACCLENTRHDVAQQGYEKLKAAFFDWNEIRVSTVKELAEVLGTLGEPAAAATRLKGILQGVFESDYSFDLEHLKKQNIGAAVKRLQKLPGASPFVVAYATQVALGGHSIPVDKGTLGAMYVLGAISQSEADAGTVPGMERAIPKSKGHEFGSLLHELGAEYFANPFANTVREHLLSIAPDAKERFPKRPSKKPVPEPAKTETKRKDKAKEVAGGKKGPIKTVEKRPTRDAKSVSRPPAKRAAVTAKKAPIKTLGKRKPR